MRHPVIATVAVAALGLGAVTAVPSVRTHFAGNLNSSANLFLFDDEPGTGDASGGKKEGTMKRVFSAPFRMVARMFKRKDDGLAMSSRNTYLTESDREVALCLSRALRAGGDAAAYGPSSIRRAAREVLVEEPLALVDYLVLVHPTTLADVPEWYRGEALLAVAARVGTTRLIDNTPVLVGPGGGMLDVFTPEATSLLARFARFVDDAQTPERPSDA